MSPYTNDEVRLIADACRDFLAAYQRRGSAAKGLTLNEETAVGAIRYHLSVREREAVKAASGTAA